MAPRKEAPAPASTPAPRPIKVQATRLGYYDHKRRREGDVFWISGERLPDDLVYPAVGNSLQPHPLAGKPHPKAGKLRFFSDSWMELVDVEVPERQTGAQEALRREHNKLIGDSNPGPRLDGPTGDANVFSG